MKVVQQAVQQPITVSVGVLLSLIAGWVALTRVPVQMTPDVQDVVITVTTTWESASPQEVESEIIDEQEEVLQGVANLRSLTSTSERGRGFIRLEFDTGTDRDSAMREVSDKLREVPSYPLNVDEPVIEDTDPESNDYIAWVMFLSEDPDFDVRTLQDFVEDRIKPRFERLPGISEVNVLGGREREVQVRFDPAKLAQRAVTVTELVAALQRTNRNMSAGAMEQGKSDVRVRTVGRYADPEQVRDTVIRQDDSGVVFVRDVADVVETFKEPLGFVRQNGHPTLAINFDRETGSNVIEVMAGLRAEIERLNAEGGLLESHARRLGLQGDLKLKQVYDQTDYIEEAIGLVRSNIWLGGLLATCVLLLFLRSLRSVGIIALAIPMSVLLAIVVMVALGRTMNVISLAGIAFAVGMVVDNAIVVLENVFRHVEMGKNVRRAAIEGASEVAYAVLASTLTTLIVFVPILLIEETAGRLFRDIAFAICAAVGLSFLVSITVIPSAAASFLRARSVRAAHGGSEDGRGPRPLRALRRIASAPRRLPRALGDLLYRINGSRLARVGVVGVFLIGTGIGIALLIPPLDYLPRGNRNLAFGLMIPPPGLNLEQLSEMGDRVEKVVRPFWEGEEDRIAVPTLGPDGMPSTVEPRTVVPPPIDNYFFVATGGTLFHGAISSDGARVVDVVDLLAYASRPEVLPGTIAFALQLPLFRLGGSTGSAVKIDLAGADLDEVSAAAGALFGALGMQFGFQSVRPNPSNFNLQAPELQIVPDLVRMSNVGLSVADLGLAVQAASDGAFVGDYEKEGTLIDLKLIAKDALERRGMVELPDVPVATPYGSTVALHDAAHFAWVSAPEQIRRVGRQRAVTLEFTAPPGMPLGQAIDGVEATVEQMRGAGAIPSTVEVQLAGTAGKLDEIRRALLGDGSIAGVLQSTLFLALLVIYLLMCVMFQSWLYPFVIMFTVPLATFGGFLGLAIVHAASVGDRYLPVQNMDVLTILGFVLLAGIVVNNAILIVAQAQNFLRNGDVGPDGEVIRMDARRAISRSVETRVRPIMMSMLTSVGGMLPLVLMPGSGSELYRGLGAVVVGGLFLSTIFTLLLVPVMLGTAFAITREGEARPAEVNA